MPRGSEYADAPAQSDNAIDAGENKAHGVGVSIPRPRYLFPSRITNYIRQNDNAGLNRTERTAEFPEGAKGTGGKDLSGQGSTGHSSGKGGHEPKTLGENKGSGAL